MGNPRAKTAEEVREEFLAHLHAITNYWAGLPNKTPQERCDGLTFSILCVFDGCSGGMPAMDISLSPHPDDQAFFESEGRNWFESGQVINSDDLLHELWCK